jgi:hypothetical protein
MPIAPGEGLTHIPRGRDRPSIRDAGMHAAQLGASPGETASPDGEGDAQEGHDTGERVNQRKRLGRWRQHGTGPGAGGSRHDRQSPHPGPGGVFPPDVHRHTRTGTGGTPGVLSQDGQSSGGGANRLAHGQGSRQKPRPPGTPEDQPTDVRWRGRERCPVGRTRHARVGHGYGCREPAPLAPAGGRGVHARTADRQSLARGRSPKSPQPPETPLEVSGGDTARRPSRHPRQPREAHGRD